MGGQQTSRPCPSPPLRLAYSSTFAAPPTSEGSRGQEVGADHGDTGGIRSAWSAAQLVGCDAKTVAHYVACRDARYDPVRRARRARLVDPYLDEIEELIERSRGKVRADVVYDRLLTMGFEGAERTVRRAVAEAKEGYRSGQRRI